MEERIEEAPPPSPPPPPPTRRPSTSPVMMMTPSSSSASSSTAIGKPPLPSSLSQRSLLGLPPINPSPRSFRVSSIKTSRDGDGGGEGDSMGGVSSPLSIVSNSSTHSLRMHNTKSRGGGGGGGGDATRSLRASRKNFSGIFKRADREIAALNFILNIPMQHENAILNQAMQQQAGFKANKDGAAGGAEGDEMVDLLDSPAAVANRGAFLDEDQRVVAAGGGPGRRLDGPNPYLVGIPPYFRYRYEYCTANVRQWEGSLGQAGITDGRLFFSANRGYPLAVSSILRYKPGVEEDKRLKAKQADERGAEAFERPVPDWRGIRYCNLLHAEWAPCSAKRDAKEGGHPSEISHYDPSLLDDPDMIQGKNRQVTVGDSTVGPVVFSVILFMNAKQLKDDLNKQFREKHPDLPPSLTLSKIRNLKRQALNGCRALDIEIGTLALACVYFEKLSLKKLVTKSNRRLAFGACLSLAYKFHEQGTKATSKLPLLLDWIDREWYTSNKQIFEAEFGVYYHLGFALHCQLYEVSHHFTRLLKLIETVPKEYLGDDMFDAYTLACLPRKEDEVEEEEEEEDEDHVSASSSAIDPQGAMEDYPPEATNAVEGREGQEESEGASLASGDDRPLARRGSSITGKSSSKKKGSTALAASSSHQEESFLRRRMRRGRQKVDVPPTKEDGNGDPEASLVGVQVNKISTPRNERRRPSWIRSWRGLGCPGGGGGGGAAGENSELGPPLSPRGLIQQAEGQQDLEPSTVGKPDTPVETKEKVENDGFSNPSEMPSTAADHSRSKSPANQVT